MLNTEDFDLNEEWQRAMLVERKIGKCPDCGCGYGAKHRNDCDAERCSSCGQQRISCGCKDHDPGKTRWMGVWPTGKEVRP
jgi:hypothetical protein